MDGAEHIIVHHARRIIEDMPSVTPTRPRGKWVQIDEVWNCKCSNCNIISGVIYDNFCPNCGAKMESEENANDD